MAACSPCDAESSIGSADLEHMLHMPNPFDASVTAEERSLLESLVSSDSESGFPNDYAKHPMPSSSQAAAPVQHEQYKSMRGKYTLAQMARASVAAGMFLRKST
eukprot:2079113-Pleurochrysis_carterae.AAC.3